MTTNHHEGIMSADLATTASGGKDAPGCIVEEYALTAKERAALQCYVTDPVGEIALGAFYLLDDDEEVDLSAGHFSHRLDDAFGILGVEVMGWLDTVVTERIGEERIEPTASRGIRESDPDYVKTLGFYLAGVISLDLADTSPEAAQDSAIALARAAGGFLILRAERISEVIGESVQVNARLVDTFSQADV